MIVLKSLLATIRIIFKVELRVHIEDLILKFRISSECLKGGLDPIKNTVLYKSSQEKPRL